MGADVQPFRGLAWLIYCALRDLAQDAVPASPVSQPCSFDLIDDPACGGPS
jgi:hypothetical protein